MDGGRYKELLRHLGRAKNEERLPLPVAAEARMENWEGLVEMEEEDDWDVERWRGGRESRSSVNLDGMVVGQRKGEIWRSLRRNQFHMGKFEGHPNKPRTAIKIAPSHRTQFSSLYSWLCEGKRMGRYEIWKVQWVGYIARVAHRCKGKEE
jgi:hypothetical protein